MQVPKPKRQRYDTQTYGRMTGDLSRLINATPHLMANRDDWDIEGDWTKAGAIHFIDQLHQSSFHDFADFDCRVIKLVNYQKPAVRLTFYPVHRYWVLKDKDLPIEERQRRILDYVNMLTINMKIQERKSSRLSGVDYSKVLGEIALMKEERARWQAIFPQLDRYELCVSNYERNHIYTNVNWKYETEGGEYQNEQMHLLSNQRDNEGNITQTRHNIIFIDPLEILRYHPYQNKQIDTFLERFEQKAVLGRDRLYARLRIEGSAVDQFEAGQRTAPTISVKRRDKMPTNTGTLDLFQDNTNS